MKFAGKLDVVGSVLAPHSSDAHRGDGGAGAKKKTKGPFRVMIDGEDVTIFNETNPPSGGASFWGGAKVKPGSNTISIVAVDSAGNRDMSVRHVVFPPTNPQQFQYDRNGNQISDGQFNYSWDEENRLIAVEGLASPAYNAWGVATAGRSSPRFRSEYKYDAQSRRIQKTVYAWSASNNEFQVSSVHHFIYDGWNMISESIQNSKSKIENSYIWGLDLSGSLQGAGGVGGLLARYRSEQRYYDDKGMLIICHRPPGNPENCKTLKINVAAWLAHQAHGDTLGACDGSSVSNTAFLYTYDGNGNVSELLQSTANGLQSIVAHYEYSPFGETVISVGPEAQDNPFRFSTKYWDSESGLYYYGFRYYSPSLERWLSRDPIKEKGFFFKYSTEQGSQYDPHQYESYLAIMSFQRSVSSLILGYKGVFENYDNHEMRFALNDPNDNIDPFGLSSCEASYTGWDDIPGYGRVSGTCTNTSDTTEWPWPWMCTRVCMWKCVYILGWKTRPAYISHSNRGSGLCHCPSVDGPNK